MRMWKDKEGNGLSTVDENEILQDHQSMRVKMMARDSSCPDCQDGVYQRAGVICPTCSGRGYLSSNGDPVDEVQQNMTTHTESARGGAYGSDAALTDAEMKDRLAADKAWRDATIGNRAGYRFAANTKDSDAARQQLHDAYAEHEHYINSAYRSLDAEFTGGPDSQMNTGQGSPARRIANPEGGAKEGDPCMDDDKRHGTLRRTAAGDLVCVANGSNEDHRTMLDKMADHRRIMQTEYEQYNRQQSEAYRNLK